MAVVATATAHGGGGGGSGGGDEFLAVLRRLRTDRVVIYLSITIAEAPSHQLLYVMSRFVTISTATAYGTTHAAGLTGPSHTPDPPSTAEAIAKTARLSQFLAVFLSFSRAEYDSCFSSLNARRAEDSSSSVLCCPSALCCWSSRANPFSSSSADVFSFWDLSFSSDISDSHLRVAANDRSRTASAAAARASIDASSEDSCCSSSRHLCWIAAISDSHHSS